MKKAVCISCTDHYQERTHLFMRYLQEQGYACTYITSDFHHMRKEKYRIDRENSIQVATMPYRKNISPQRILSHMKFAKDAMKLAGTLNPDVLYVEVPPNSLCREAAKYKKKHPNVRLILDVFDLWPESFPNNRAKSLLKIPFDVWAWFRNSGLPCADLVFTECRLFRDKLERYLHGARAEVLYLSRPAPTAHLPLEAPQTDALHLCYLGSINNLIDIPLIAEFIGAVQKRRPVVLEIIGDGESRENFISAVRETGAEVVFHGKVYDAEVRQAIFDRCHFGLNIMKDSVCVGLTMKSVDYFAGALPVLNTIQGDTWELVEKEKIGWNLERRDVDRSAERIARCSREEQTEMRRHLETVFLEMFSEERLEKRMASALENIL
ncbi:MAG TPA: glycosyltransferase [Candidatus Faecousia intestinigallinarum]|nr:glycosyltransferase [Candidatus Faecousia intestinigallinarum]